MRPGVTERLALVVLPGRSDNPAPALCAGSYNLTSVLPAAPDMAQLKQGVRSVAGKLSVFANGVMTSIQVSSAHDLGVIPTWLLRCSLDGSWGGVVSGYGAELLHVLGGPSP